MLGHNFRHDLIKKHIAMFGALFNDMVIERLDSKKDVWNQIKIPLTYGPRDRLLASAQQDFQSTKMAVSLTSPRMSFELDNIQRDPSRGTNPLQKRRIANQKHIYNTIPTNFDFSLYVVSKNQTDGNRIIEQILPFFQPSLVISMFLFGTEDHSISKDLKVVLNSVSCEDQYEGVEASRQSVLWTLQFTMQGFLMGPVYAGGIIKKIEMNLRPNDEIPLRETIVIRPGLTADVPGLPTNDPLLTIPYTDITNTDNWDFITEYESGQ